MAPKQTTVNQIVVTDAPGGWHEMAVTMTSPESPNCLRERQDLLVQGAPPRGENGGAYVPPGGHYYALGSARNGMGMGRAGTFTVHYATPPSIVGEWTYLSRVTFTCPILGVLSRTIAVQGEPVRVMIGGQ